MHHFSIKADHRSVFIQSYEFRFINISQMMNSDQKTKCNQCLQHFNLHMKPLKMPICAHNICEKCYQEIKSSKQKSVHCYFCDTISNQCSEKSFQLNKQLMKKIKQNQVVHSDKRAEKAANHKKNITEFSMKHQVIQAEDNQLLLGNQQKEEENDCVVRLKSRLKPTQLCGQHQKALEIICLSDLKTICPHCAIFGNHKNHIFKTLKEFYKDFDINCKTLSMIKKKKYTVEKKIKNSQEKQKSINQIKKKQSQCKELLKKKFEELYNGLKNLEKKVYAEIQKKFAEAEKQAEKIMKPDAKIEEQFLKWQSRCQNVLNKVQEEDGTLDQKIKLLYGNLCNVQEGEQIVGNLEKKYGIIFKKMEKIKDSVVIEFSDVETVLSSFVTINKKVEDNKKESFMSIIDKINIPVGKHLLDELDDYSDNSFICDYSQNDLSLVLDSGGSIKNKPKTETNIAKSRLKTQVSPKNKKPSIAGVNSKINRKQNEKDFGYATTKLNPKNGHHLNSENQDFNKKKMQSKLMRSKSNLGPTSFQSEREVSVKSHKEKSEIIKTQKKLVTSRVYEQIERVPEIIMEDFLKHDLKQVLDFSNCDIKDEQVWQYLKRVRKARKIRAIKLSQNALTDACFPKILQFLNSTTNLNLAYNNFTEYILTAIIEHRDKLIPLRIVNLSFNKINQQHAKSKIGILKKMGVIINL